MYRDEEISIVVGRKLGPVDEGNEHFVLFAGHEDLDAWIEVLYLFLKELGYLERKPFLICLPVLAYGSGVLPAVTWIYDDGAQSQRSGVLGGSPLETAGKACGKDCGTVYDSFQIHLRTLVNLEISLTFVLCKFRKKIAFKEHHILVCDVFARPFEQYCPSGPERPPVPPPGKAREPYGDGRYAGVFGA